MTTFPEFLIEKNLVSADQLARVLVEQVGQLPSIAEIIFKHRLLQSRDLVAVLCLQSKESMSFQSACETLHLWNSEIAEKIKLESDLGFKSLGELLIKTNLLTSTVLERAIAEYQSLKDLGGSIEPGSSAMLSAELPVFSAVEASIDRSGIQIHTLLEEFVGEFQLAELRKHIGVATRTGFIEESERMASIAVLQHRWHRLKGVATYIDAAPYKSLAQVFALAENASSSMALSSISDGIRGDLQICMETLVSTLESFRVSALALNTIEDKCSVSGTELQKLLELLASGTFGSAGAGS